MKKTLAIILSVLLALSMLALAGCGGDKPTETDPVSQTDNGTTAKTDADNGDQTNAVDTADTAAPGTWSDDTAEYTYYIDETNYGTDCYVVIKNKTDKDIGISLTAHAKDASGADVGDEGWISINVVGAGQTTMRVVGIGEAAGAATLAFEPEYSDSLYKDATADMSFTDKVSDDDPDAEGVTVDLTNNGADPIKNAFAYALFFDADGKLVGESTGSFSDDDFEIKAGATETRTLYFYEDFASYKIYISGDYGLSF